MSFNIPATITQGDRISWIESFLDFQSGTDTVSCFIRGAGSLDLTAVGNGNEWHFEITSTQSQALNAGGYCAQFAAFVPGFGRKTLGVVRLVVCPNFALVTELLETRTSDEIELEQVNVAIAKLNEGVAEYHIGERRVRYHEIDKLYERQRYLQIKINRAKNRHKKRGNNVPIRFDY